MSLPQQAQKLLLCRQGELGGVLWQLQNLDDMRHGALLQCCQGCPFSTFPGYQACLKYSQMKMP